MYSPAAGSGDWGSSDRSFDSSRNIAEVRPVRQPWSICVAHQSSSVSSDWDGVSGLVSGEGEGK